MVVLGLPVSSGDSADVGFVGFLMVVSWWFCDGGAVVVGFGFVWFLCEFLCEFL